MTAKPNRLCAEVRAMPSARALMLRTQRLRLFAVPVSIAIALAGCRATPQEIAAQEQILAERAAQRAYDDAYDSCMYRATGPFAAASIEVMRECQGLARQGSSAGKAPQ